MEFAFLPSIADASDTDLLAVFIADPTLPPAAVAELDAALDGALARELARGRVRPGKGDVVLVPGGETGPQRIALFTTGTEHDGRDNAVRVAGARLAATARSARARNVALVAVDDEQSTTQVLVGGFGLGAYTYKRFKSKDSGDEGDDGVDTGDGESRDVTLTIVGASDEARARCDLPIRLAAATNWARDLANTPSNHLTPASLAAAAESLASRHPHLTVTVLDERQIEAKGMGLLTAVGQGSSKPPRLIALAWNPPGATETDDERLAFVGKAVTFDTGGISIKPSAGMHEMKLDKAGGCAVLGAVRAIAELNVQHRVLAIVGAAENMPSGTAYKPGDVITAMDGTSVEVTNTDAEGRLVLADAMLWANELGCGRIVELSTLTGAMVVAMGSHFTGAIARKGDWVDTVLRGAEATGEHAWHLPMHDAYKPALKSECADMVNSGPRWAGSLYAGLFLEHFAQDHPFVHLDIAGTAMLSKPQGVCTVSGASGYGVRLLTWLATHA